jgi:hypothetical protein
MLIPQYSLRWLFAATAVCAVIFSLVGLALRGSHWPAAISVAIGALLIVSAIHVLLFTLVGLYAAIFKGRGSAADANSPASRLPPPLLWLAALALLGAAAAQGAVLSPAGAPAKSSISTAPTRQFTGHGLRLDLETWPLRGGGYRPLWVTITPIVPLAAARTLVLEFRQKGHSFRDSGADLCVRRAIVVPAGSATLRFSLSLPRWGDWDECSTTVVENDDVLPALSSSWNGWNNSSTFLNWDWAFPRILAMGGTEPDTTKLAQLFPMDAFYQLQPPYQPQSAASPFKPLPSVIALPAAEFPRRWIDYTSLDIVCLTLDQLATLHDASPATLNALLAWVGAGGNLWVSGAERRQLPQLEHCLDIFAISTLDVGSANRSPWTEPDRSLRGNPLDLPYNPRGNSGPYFAPTTSGGFATATSPIAPPANNAKAKRVSSAKPVARPPFVTCPLGLGLVVAVAAESPFPGDEAQWTWLLNSMGSHRWLWELRHGLSIEADNPDFWKFLIPGIGLAPVTAFCVLITLFVVLIGPVNYGLLWRWKRLHLLVVTIPLGAGLVTAALFTYASLADGFATRVRARSLTWIDQRRGQAACWTRLSYYAGLSPAGGLTFPADVAVLPLEHSPASQRGGRGDQRVLEWEGDQQHLAAGFVPARTPTQLLTIRSRPSESGLSLLAPRESAGRPRIVNRLGAQISQLVVRTADGRYHQAADVAADATVVLQPLEGDAATSLLGPIYRDHLPALPPGVEPSPYASMSVFSAGRYYQRYRFGVRPPTQETSVLEKTMSRWLASRTFDAPIPRGSYVAIVARNPEVLLGTPLAREEAGFHVICGEW